MTYTQNIKPTKEQEQRIRDIFTPEYVIESSKPISIVKEQDSVIAVRDIQIQELQKKISDLKEEHLRTITEIAINNQNAREDSNEISEISEDLLSSEKKKWKGLHLYIGSEIPELQISTPSFNSELMYELRNFHFGLKGEAVNIQIENNNQYQFSYQIKLRYKIF